MNVSRSIATPPPRVLVLLFLFAAFFSLIPSSVLASPKLVEERLMCTIAEVQLEAGRLRLLCGQKQGVAVGQRGEIYGHPNAGNIGVVGRAEVVEAGPRESWLRVVPEAGSKPEAMTEKGGTVELRVLLPADVHRGLLFAIAIQGITFLDNRKQPIATLEELLGARDDTVERRALASMVTAGIEVIGFTESFKEPLTHGKWKGQVCKQILAGSGADDYRAFLRFVRDYPGKYVGKEWRISETYATWIINDEPLSVEDLVAELEALGLSPALDARAAALKEDDAVSVFERVRRDITDWPKARMAEAEKRLAMLERIFLARSQGTFLGKAPSPLLAAEIEQTRARILARDPSKLLSAAEAYGRAAAEYARVAPGDMREAPLERIVCLNNQAGFLDDAGKPDDALGRIPAIRALVAQVVAHSPDAEIAAHARLSEAFSIALGARIANERGDYRKVIADITPILDRYGAVGAPGFREKEIELIQFLAKAHKKLGEIDAATALLGRAKKRAGELGDLVRQAEIEWSIGDLHYDGGRYLEAIADYQRTADLARQAGDKAWLAKALAATAQSLWSLGRSTEAIAQHAEGLRVREETGDESGMAWQLLQVGKIRVELGEREAARRDFERALALRRKEGARKEEAEVHRQLGNLFLALQMPADAEREQAAARAIYRALGMAPDEAWAALGEANARAVRHDYAGALERAGEAVAIGDRTGERELRVRARLGRSGWLYSGARRAEARPVLEEALAAATDDIGLKNDVLLARAGQRQNDGDLAAAAIDVAEALKLSEHTSDVARRIAALLARAGILEAEGQYEPSLHTLGEVESLARKSGNRPVLQSALHKKAWELANLGRLKDARSAADEALILAGKNNDDVERAGVLNVLARIADDEGDLREELRLYDEGIPLMRKAGHSYGEAALIFNRALVSGRLRDFDEALRGFDETARLAVGVSSAELEIQLAGARGQVLGQLERYDEADAALALAADKAQVSLPQLVPSLMAVRGRLLAKRGEPVSLPSPGAARSPASPNFMDRALSLLEQAAAIAGRRSSQAFGEMGELGIARARAGKPEAEATLVEAIARAERAGGAIPWEPLYQLGRIEAESGRGDDAEKTLERAAREIEKGEVVLQTDVAKSRYWGDKAGVYRLLVKLLLGMNRVGDALRYVERAKAAELEDLRRQSGGREGNAGLGLELEISESRFAEALRVEQSRARPDADKMRRLDELLADVRRRRGDYIDQLDRQLGDKPGGARDVYAIRPLELEKLQEWVPAGMLVISPIVLDDKLVVFAITHDAITHFDAAVGTAEIDRLVGAVLEEVAPPGGAQRGARPLQRTGTGRRVDEASVTRMREPAKRLYDLLLRPALARFGMPKVLVVSASGGLRYLPFSALHDGSGWLVDKTALIEVTSLDQQKFAAQPPSDLKARVLALADPDGSLPGARREVAEVNAVYGDVRVLDGAGATLQALREQIRAPGYEIVHLATHGRLDGAHPEQSNILLSGQSLYYRDIPGLRFAHTRLVVLSACDTASRGSGVEVTGLAYQFERTNVRAVLATLWPVDDAATAHLMAEFYRRLRSGSGYVDALAAAQRSLAADPVYKHPYYWAPFILIGAP